MALSDVKGWFTVRPGPRRWVNLPFVLFLLATLVLSHGDETFEGLWPYFVLLPLFTIQLVWPTLAGWVLTILGWADLTAIFWGLITYDAVNDVPQFSRWALVLWTPVVLLLAIRPKAKSGWGKKVSA